MSEHNLNAHDRVKVIANLLEQNLSLAEIGRRLGVTRSRISQIVRAHGLARAEISTAGHRDARPLTQRQSRMLAFIRDFTAHNSYPPTLREIAGGCNISSISVVDYNLRRLEEREYLTRLPVISRTVVLTERGRAEAASC
ncbi:MAG: hypothetical protein OXI33_13895 [Chloroflexota bacterium]|nr:hypothetical protein [Chloroflexota bacterium]